MDSAPSNLVTGTSPAVPAAPVLAGPTFADLVASLVVTMPTVDANGAALPGNLTNIKIFFGPSGTVAGNTAIVPVEFPGSYPPGSQQTVSLPVPAPNTAYDFESEVSI